MDPVPFPKIELHVHLEGAIRPRDLFEMAARNDVELPAADETDLERLYRFRDFEHFLELWMITTKVVQTEEDFRQVVLSYAREAAAHGAVYLEGIFAPAERVRGGASWDEVFTGFCDGAMEASSQVGIEVRLTPDTPRNWGLDVALQTARYAIKYRDSGIVVSGWAERRQAILPSHSKPCSVWPRRGESARYPTPVRWLDPVRSVVRSIPFVPTGFGTAFGRSRTQDCCASWPTGGSSVMSARCPTCAPGPCLRWKSTRSRQ